MTEAPYEMANLFPKHTGLPFVVWISIRGGARHDVRVKVSQNANATPEEMISVGVRPSPWIVAGELPSADWDKLYRWIELNKETLIAYWYGEIDTQDALEALKKL